MVLTVSGATAGAEFLCTPPPQVVDAGVAAAEKLGLSWQQMVSRAYHDSLFMAKASSSRMPLRPAECAECRGALGTERAMPSTRRFLVEHDSVKIAAASDREHMSAANEVGSHALLSQRHC